MLGLFVPVAKQSLREPREAAATLLSMGVPKPVLWPGFALLVVLSVILIFASGPPTGPSGEVIVSPFGLTISSALAGAASVFLVWKIGGLLGGKGGFDETLLLTVFLQGMIFVGQLVELAVFFVIPPLADIYYIALIVFMFWLNLNFIAVLHGFGSLWRAFGVLVLASIGVAFVLVFAMSLAGVRIAGAA
ncbi:MAG: YIP1 family protein [Boseongicola sp.]